MTTRAIVPNGDGEGSLGTASLKWGKVYSSNPASGENSGQVPTTAWVQTLVAKAVKDATDAQSKAYTTAIAAAQKQAKLDAHPVGSYYFSDDATSPADLFGGTWEALPAGYTLIAQGSGTDDFGSFTYKAGEKYGERMHKLTVNELPPISGSISQLIRWDSNQSSSGVLSGKSNGTKFPSTASENASDVTISLSFGGGKSHQNIQPVKAVYAWLRTA